MFPLIQNVLTQRGILLRLGPLPVSLRLADRRLPTPLLSPSEGPASSRDVYRAPHSTFCPGSGSWDIGSDF